MADLNFKDTSQPVQIVGADPTGTEGTPVKSTLNGDLGTADVISVSGVNGAISVNTTASEAKAGATRLALRKFISITPTAGTVYWGTSAAVTTATGTPIFKNQQVTFAFTDNVPIYLIAASTIDVRIVEGA